MKQFLLPQKKSFTLIELVVSVTIIGLLSAMMIPKVMQGIDKSRVASVVTDSRNIRNAAYAMYADTGLWPGSNWSDDTGTDPLAGAAGGEGFTFKGTNPHMPSTWAGPYLEAWHKNAWGSWYWWDYNETDQNGDGVGNEHVLWVDNSYGNTKRIPLNMRTKIDQTLDDGNLHSGTIQVWQGDDTSGNLGYILIQGFS